MTSHYLETDEEFIKNWQNEPYEYNDYREYNKQYTTLRGEKVRSKSEQMIANILFHVGVPYKYECPLFLGFHKYHPDFTVLDIRRRKVIFWEHFGRADDPHYSSDALFRIAAYSSTGFNIVNDLIVTCESSEKPFDADSIMPILTGRGLIPYANIK